MNLDGILLRARTGLSLLAGLVGLSTVALGVPGHSAGQPAQPAAVSPTASATQWSGVVDRLGEQRSRAWRRGDPALLDRVFVPGTAPWRDERRLMRAYTGRGLWVLGLSLVVDDVYVTASGARWVRLCMVDRVHPAVAVGRDGRRHRLPHDSATRHVVTLERSAFGWRISAVQLVRS